MAKNSEKNRAQGGGMQDELMFMLIRLQDLDRMAERIFYELRKTNCGLLTDRALAIDARRIAELLVSAEP